MSERRSELKAVNAAAEQAMGVAGRDVSQMAAVWVDNWNQINGRLAEDINETIIGIFEACNFQDITGQRITKVV
ncbi:MAG TPA: hypothetical protein VK196_14955, partial [Magnetospirillum sp.]|nr:hypothetical protein [Magnetospirillum sp.]